MKKLLVISLFTMTVAGCANTLPKQAFNSSANAHVERITIIQAPQVDKVAVEMLVHPGQSFGLIGAVAAISDMSNKTKLYNKALGADQNWNVYAQEQLSQALTNAGYKVNTVIVKRLPITPFATKQPEFLKTYPALETDAILDYYFTVTQLAAGATTSYVPTVNLSTRLVNNKNKTVIYQSQFNAGLANQYQDKAIINIPTSTEYHNISELNANASSSADALKQNIQQIAQRIASDLTKQPK